MAELQGKMIEQIRKRAESRAAQYVIERLLNQREFRYIESTGCWVMPGSGTRVFVDGSLWLVYHPGDKPDKPMYSGAGFSDFVKIVEVICG
jgi:hypothetical protein